MSMQASGPVGSPAAPIRRPSARKQGPHIHTQKDFPFWEGQIVQLTDAGPALPGFEFWLYH